jgi:hypothetical protein
MKIIKIPWFFIKFDTLILVFLCIDDERDTAITPKRNLLVHDFLFFK